MPKGRLEAFSDGVIAIIITIMVLELKVPHGEDFSALIPIWPTFLSYVLSFVYVGIYWNNHHHMLQLVHHVSGHILWANLNLLFWLSLLPVATAFMGTNEFATVPVAVYGVDLLMCAIAYSILEVTLRRSHGPDSPFAKAVGTERKEKISLAAYVAAIPLTFVNRWIGVALYVAVAATWFIPDRRFEKEIG